MGNSIGGQIYTTIDKRRLDHDAVILGCLLIAREDPSVFLDLDDEAFAEVAMLVLITVEFNVPRIAILVFFG